MCTQATDQGEEIVKVQLTLITIVQQDIDDARFLTSC